MQNHSGANFTHLHAAQSGKMNNILFFIEYMFLQFFFHRQLEYYIPVNTGSVIENNNEYNNNRKCENG